MGGPKPRGWSWALLVIVAASGCYEWILVPPSELPRLDERAPNGTAVVRDDRGKNVEVVDDFAVKVTTATDSVDFMSPVRCSINAGTLQLAQDDDKPQAFLLSEIKSTELYRYDRPLTQIVVTLGIVAALAGGLLLGYGVAHSGP